MKLFLWFLFFTMSGHTKTIGLEDIGPLLTKNNGNVLAAWYEKDSAENRRGVLKRSFLPQLRLEAGRERFQTGPYNTLTEAYGSMALSVNVFNSGKDVLKDNIIDARSQLAKYRALSTEMDNLSEVRSLYWQAIYQKEVANILKEALKLNERNLALAKKKINAGLSSPTDSLDFEQFKLQVMQQVERSAAAIQNLQDLIKGHLGLEGDIEFEDKVIPHLHTDEILTRELNEPVHREIRALSSKQNVLKNEQSLRRRWWAPNIDLYASFSQFTQKERDYPAKSERDDRTVGIMIKMIVFDGGESFNESNSTALNLRAIEHRADQKMKEISVRFANAKRLLKMTHELVHLAEANVDKAHDYFDRILKEYEKGVKNTPDVLQASSRLIDAKIKYLELRRDYQLARVDFMNALGE